MRLLLLVGLVLTIFWFVRSNAKGATAQRLHEITDAIREKAVRDAFIASPTAPLHELVDIAMDKIATAGMTIQDRSGLRKVLSRVLPKQVGRYAAAATGRVESTLMSLNSRDDRLRLKRGDLLEEVLGTVNATLIDELAASTGEHIDNGVGLRGAMKTVATAHFERLIDQRPSNWELPSTGTLAWPCPKCDVLLRDMASPTCRECGHRF
jgi:hypothetical protein